MSQGPTQANNRRGTDTGATRRSDDNIVQCNEKCEELMAAGVTIVDPRNTIIGMQATIAADTIVQPGCRILGDTHIATGCEIGPNTTIVDSIIGQRSRIRFSELDCVTIEPDANIGPFQKIGNRSRRER